MEKFTYSDSKGKERIFETIKRIMVKNKYFNIGYFTTHGYENKIDENCFGIHIINKEDTDFIYIAGVVNSAPKKILYIYIDCILAKLNYGYEVSHMGYDQKTDQYYFWYDFDNRESKYNIDLPDNIDGTGKLEDLDKYGTLTYKETIEIYYHYCNCFKQFIEEQLPEVQEKDWYPKFLDALERLNQKWEEMQKDKQI